MAAFNFPNSPSTNDLHTENSVTWKWDGVMWNRVGPAYTDTTNLNVTGIGTFAGNVFVGGMLTYEDVRNIDAIGIVTARQGIDVTSGSITIPDKIIHSGDTNTSIRFPAADTVTVETGGSERLRVASDGKIGIGINDPERLLHLSSDNTVIALTDTAASTDQKSKYILTDAGVLGIGGLNDAYDTATEYLRIDNSGRLLLGTTTEGAVSADDLTLATSGSTGITIRSGTSNSGSVFFSDGTSGNDEYRGYIQYQHNLNTLVLGSNAQERVNILSGGGVGIGDSLYHLGDTNTQIRFPGNDQVSFETNGSERLRISAGTAGTCLLLAGSRTDSADKTLRLTLNHYSFDTVNAIEVIGATTRSGYNRVHIGGADDSAGNTAATEIKFYTAANATTANGTERLRITSAGRVGIAEDDPDTTLHVKVTSTEGIRLERNGGTVAEWVNDTDLTTFGTTSNHNVAFKTNGTERMRVTNGGLDPTSDAVTDLGTSSKRFRDLYLSSGVFLGGTGSANELEDYEEGTWTPVLKDAASGGNTYSGGGDWTTYASYTKIGRIVHVYHNAYALSDTGMTGGNGIFVHGFPFTASGGTQVAFVKLNYFTGFADDEFGPYTQVNNNETIGRLHRQHNGAGSSSNTAITWDDIATNGYFGFQYVITYRV